MLDVHSHILPALDDGVKTLEESLSVLRGLEKLGFTQVVSTTHFYPGRYTPSAEAVEVAFVAVSETAKKQGIALELLRGRECFFDFALTEHPERETFPFTYGKGRFLLIEFPQFWAPQAVQTYSRDLARQKITPVLAHAERLSSVMKDPTSIQTFVEMGFRVQVDLLSFHSSAHPAMREAAEALLSSDSISVLASDVHHLEQLPALEESANALSKRLGKRWKDFFELP